MIEEQDLAPVSTVSSSRAPESRARVSLSASTKAPDSDRELLGNRFSLSRQVASGAMGSVHQAWDSLAGEHVAVKLLHTDSARFTNRFEREATLLAELSHPAIVRYVAHGRRVSGEPYLAMEWLEGHTLETRLRVSGLTALESVTVALQVLEGCAALHRAGIVHRDIKPANLFLVDGDVTRVKIADLGIARRVSDPQRLTHPGIVVGTPLYMSPEQARGDATTTACTDVFSAGCVLFECLTGDAPFVGSNVMAILAKIILENPVPTRTLCPGLPPALDALVDRMLVKDPASRPSAALLAAELREIQNDLTAASTTPGFAHRTTRPSARVLGTRGEQRVMCVVLVSGERTAQTTTAEVPTLPANIGSATLDGASPMGRVHADLVHAFLPYGGRLDRLVDGSMIISVPDGLAPTEQAIRAARCAVIVKAALPSHSVLLCTGRAVLGGRVPIGAVIDRGARLLDSSAPGVILVDEASAGLLSGRFEMRGTDQLRELGKEQLQDDSPRTLLGRVTECVGREPDLDMMRRAFEDCIDGPGARALLVTGPAGGGKSRLKHEFLSRLRKDGRTFELLVGRADSMHAGSPYALLAPALRHAAGIDDADSLELKCHKVLARVGRHVASGRAEYVAQFLGELMGVPFPAKENGALASARLEPRLMGDQILACWLDFLEAECAAGPVLIALEDLHWGDLPSVQLVDAALRALEDGPLMVLGFARPEIDEHFPGLFRQREVLALNLGRLPRKAGEKLVEAVLGDSLVAEKRAFLVKRSDGNAFYLEELIRAVAAGAPDSELPDTVLGMLQARLDRVGDEGRRILSAASVFGETFRTEGVRALLGGERCLLPIEDWMATFLEQEMIFSRGHHGEYAFRSALLRDAAYATLTDDDRVLGHRLAAHWLERDPEQAPLVLAEHFERGREVARAARHYRSAAEKSLEASDLAGVVSCSDHGVACGAAGEILGDLASLKAEAHQWRGEFAEAEMASRDALSLLSAGSAGWYRAAGTLVMACCRRGSIDDAESVSEQMLDLAESTVLDAPRSIPMALAAADVMLAGRLSLAEWMIARVQKDVVLGEASRVDGYLEAARAMIAVVKSADPSSCLKHARAALTSFQAAGDLRSVSWQRVNEGFALLELGQYAEAEFALGEAIVAAERIGAAPIAASARQNQGVALLYRGALDKAELALTAATESFRQQGDLRQEGACRMYNARREAEAGHFRRAETEAHKATELLEQYPGQQVLAFAVLAHVHLTAGSTAQALTASLAAADLLQRTLAIDEGESFVRLVHVKALERAGEDARALACLREAEERVRERAAKISDATLRKSFLENVSENREILALAKARGIS